MTASKPHVLHTERVGTGTTASCECGRWSFAVRNKRGAWAKMERLFAQHVAESACQEGGA